jgi:hypothetical protein
MSLLTRSCVFNYFTELQHGDSFTLPSDLYRCIKFHNDKLDLDADDLFEFDRVVLNISFEGVASIVNTPICIEMINTRTGKKYSINTDINMDTLDGVEPKQTNMVMTYDVTPKLDNKIIKNIHQMEVLKTLHGMTVRFYTTSHPDIDDFIREVQMEMEVSYLNSICNDLKDVPHHSAQAAFDKLHSLAYQYEKKLPLSNIGFILPKHLRTKLESKESIAKLEVFDWRGENK